jgi:hypothetical protein
MGSNQTNLEQAKRGKKREAGSTKRQQLGEEEEGRKKERKQASKQARLSFCTDYNNKLQLRAWDLKRQTLIKFDPINFESKQ